jgi:hypothetical protein
MRALTGAALLLGACALGCATGGPGSTGCSDGLRDQWLATSVVDPRAPTETFRLSLRIDRSAAGDWTVMPDSGMTLRSSDGNDLALEAGASVGPAECPDDADVVVAQVRYVMMLAPPRWESLRAQRRGDILEGSITIEGLPTDFVAHRAP